MSPYSTLQHSMNSLQCKNNLYIADNNLNPHITHPGRMEPQAVGRVCVQYYILTIAQPGVKIQRYKDMELCTNGDYIIAKKFNILLNIQTEDMQTEDKLKIV